MNERHDAHGRISIHQEGLGTVTRHMLEERAKELAVIADRSRVTREDRIEARKELMNAGGDFSELDAAEDDLDSLDPSDIRAESGHRAPTVEAEDEQAVVRDMVEHGVNEADHEQMLEGHRRREEDADLENESGAESDRKSEKGNV